MKIIKKVSTQKSRKESAIRNINIIEKELISNFLQAELIKSERDKLLSDLIFWSEFVTEK